MAFVSAGIRTVCLAIALTVCSPIVQSNASEIDRLFRQILQNPDDIGLNLRYAAMAEDQGLRRRAFAAYERVLASHPDNVDALQGFVRVRRLLKPDVTSIQVDTGINFETNPRQLPSDEKRTDDLTYDGGVWFFDERTLADRRWRTLANTRYQFQHRLSDLDTGIVALYSGPLIDLGPSVLMHIAPSLATAWLDGRHFYNEAGGRVGFETPLWGQTQKLWFSLAYRDVAARFRGSDGVVASAGARLFWADNLRTGDSFYFLPRLSYSAPDDDGPGRVFTRPLSPGDFWEAGARLAYFLPPMDGIHLGAGLSVYHRNYDQTVAFSSQLRRDWRIEPTAHVVLPHLFHNDFGLRFDYRFELNQSNDDTEDFDNHVVGLHVVRGF